MLILMTYLGIGHAYRVRHFISSTTVAGVLFMILVFSGILILYQSTILEKSKRLTARACRWQMCFFSTFSSNCKKTIKDPIFLYGMIRIKTQSLKNNPDDTKNYHPLCWNTYVHCIPSGNVQVQQIVYIIIVRFKKKNKYDVRTDTVRYSSYSKHNVFFFYNNTVCNDSIFSSVYVISICQIKQVRIFVCSPSMTDYSYSIGYTY